MSSIADIQKAALKRCDQEAVKVIWLAGSGTFAADSPNVPAEKKIPEILRCVPADAVVGRFGVISTPFGQVNRFTLMEVDGWPVGRVPFHNGWPMFTFDDTNSVFWLFHQLGVEWIITDASVGGVAENTRPWDTVVPDDIFVNAPAKAKLAKLAPAINKRAFARMDPPFCSYLRQILLDSLSRLELQGTEELHHRLGRIYDGGVYYTTPPGVVETAWEIKDLVRRGVTVVGQSSGQEAAGARIAGMHFAVLNPVANFAAGREGGVWLKGETMAQLYMELVVPMAVVMWWSLQAIIAQLKLGQPKCSCDELAESVDLSEIWA